MQFKKKSVSRDLVLISGGQWWREKGGSGGSETDGRRVNEDGSERMEVKILRGEKIKKEN